MVLGYMFRPHCGHLLANLYRLSALNVRTIWDPIVCAIMTYVRYKTTVKNVFWKVKYVTTFIQIAFKYYV
jgi:hypothetical protein